MPPIAQERHLNRFVRQLEGLFGCQEVTNFETVELLRWFEEAKYVDLELVIVHSCGVWACRSDKDIVGDAIVIILLACS